MRVDSYIWFIAYVRNPRKIKSHYLTSPFAITCVILFIFTSISYYGRLYTKERRKTRDKKRKKEVEIRYGTKRNGRNDYKDINDGLLRFKRKHAARYELSRYRITSRFRRRV